MKYDVLVGLAAAAVLIVWLICLRLNDIARGIEKLNEQVEKEYGR